jgi:septal ring factor EnvC (AmiA/AmiB activator)
METVQREFSRLDKSVRKEREIRASLEKRSQDQSLAIRELFEQITGMKEEMTKDVKKVRTSLPRLAPLHTHMSISRRYNGITC